MIVTDAWFPQTNGVVSTLAQTAAWLGRFGHEVRMITPRDFRSVACPTYPEIRLSILPYKKVKRSISEFSPQALHIATEGPLGLSARRFCLKAGMRFTTSYHTQFPQYLRHGQETIELSGADREQMGLSIMFLIGRDYSAGNSFWSTGRLASELGDPSAE